jgi:hypothetical protein
MMMMKKIIKSGLICLTLVAFYGVPGAFASFGWKLDGLPPMTYPVGSLSSPVMVYESFTSDDVPRVNGVPVPAWKILLYGNNEASYFYSDCFLISETMDNSFSFNLPDDDYMFGVKFYKNTACSIPVIPMTLEDSFNVFTEPITPIVSLPVTAGSDLLAYVGRLFTDTWVLIALAVGVPLGFYVIKRAINIVKK